MQRREVRKHIMIIGPQGSGKTALAREMASKEGEFVHCDISVVNTMLFELLSRKPKTVIVEGSPADLKLPSLVERSSQVRLKHRDGSFTMLDRPHFIFCCDELAANGCPKPHLLDIITLRGTQ